MNKQNKSSADWIFLALLVFGTILVGTFWEVAAGPSGADMAEQILREREEGTSPGPAPYRYRKPANPDFGR